MKILVFNQDWFVKEWREAGHEVLSCGLASHLDVRFEIPLNHIDSIISLLPNKFNPDVLVFMDNSAPLMVAGLEEISTPAIFYSVDTQHHFDLHGILYGVFDEMLVAQKDYIPGFNACGASPEWMPLWASRHVDAAEMKNNDAVFVGTLNQKLNPDRVRFFDELSKLVPIHITTGDYWKIFPFSEIVVNQTVKGDLNFRVFEAMMCGTMLLTERSGNGLFDLFKDQVHLVSYEKGNAAQAAELIKFYLNDRTRARQIAKAGREAILAAHLPKHRAARMLQIVTHTRAKRPSNHRCFGVMTNMSALAKGLEKTDSRIAGRSLVLALRAADQGVKSGEKLTEDMACYAISAAIRYDRLLRSTAGEELLCVLSEAYPELVVLKLARIRNLLNRGKKVEAEELAAGISNEQSYQVFCKAESFIGELLA